jgi:hypothetical protein
VSVLQLTRNLWQQGRIPLPALLRTLGLQPDAVRRSFPQLSRDGPEGPQFLRSCQRTHRESRALLARVRRSAFAVLASSVVLAPILIASLSAAGHHIHSPDRLWLLALAVSALSALALIVAALCAVRCLTLSRSGTPSLARAWGSQKLMGKKTDLAQQGEILLERAQGNRQRAQQGVAPLAVAQRSLAIAILTLVLAGAAVLVAAVL